MKTIWQDLRFGWRVLRKNPGFTLAAVLTLALGVGANVAVFAVVESVLLRPLPYPEAEQLVILKHRDQRTGITKEFVAIGDYIDLAARQSSFESFGGYGGSEVTIFEIGEPFRVRGLLASPGLFETLRLQPVLGRNLQADDMRPGAAPVMMLGYDLWQTRFAADPKIVGRGIRVGQAMRQVVGVAPPGFRFPANARTEVILPLTMPLQAPANRKSNWVFAVARLKSNISTREAAASLATLSQQLAQEFPQSNQGSEYFFLPLRDALVGETKGALTLLLAAVGVVLLIACTNVANLLLARSLARRQEMALRMALGAGRGRLIWQLLTESIVLVLGAGVIGVLVAQWGAYALVALVPKSVSIPGLADVRINGTVLLFALGISVLTVLVIGLVSALTVRFEKGTSILGVLGTSGRASSNAATRRATSALVVAEVALAIVLLIGAGLILRSFARLLTVDPGFRTDRVLTMGIAVQGYGTIEARQAFYQRAFAALRGVNEVEELGAAVVVPLTGNNWTVPFERADRPVGGGERPPEVGWQVASGGYFKTLQIPLKSGRLFDERDGPNGSQTVIISEAIERRFFSGESAVGRQIKLGNQTSEIVGVVGNIRRAGLRDEPRADMYFPFEHSPSNQITLFLRTKSDPLRSLSLMQTALRSIEPNVVFQEVQTLTETASESVAETNLALWLLGIFAATALVLAAVGIYGVMSYVVRQRTREIGVRVALGATRRDIIWLVMREGAGIAAVGTAIGLIVGFISARSLAALLYGTSTYDPLTLGVAAVGLFVTTMVACYIPARRAASIDPVRTLAEQ